MCCFKLISTDTSGFSCLVGSLCKLCDFFITAYNVEDDGRLKPEVGDSLTFLPASFAVLSDTTKDYLRYPNSCCSGPSRPRTLLRLVHVQPPARNKVDGAMEAALERGGEGDGAPSAEIEGRHQGEREEEIFYFPSGLDERSVTLA